MMDPNLFALEPANQRGWRAGQSNGLEIVHGNDGWAPPVGVGQEDEEDISSPGYWLPPTQEELDNMPPAPGQEKKPLEWWQWPNFDQEQQSSTPSAPLSEQQNPAAGTYKRPTPYTWLGPDYNQGQDLRPTTAFAPATQPSDTSTPVRDTWGQDPTFRTTHPQSGYANDYIPPESPIGQASRGNPVNPIDYSKQVWRGAVGSTIEKLPSSLQLPAAGALAGGVVAGPVGAIAGGLAATGIQAAGQAPQGRAFGQFSPSDVAELSNPEMLIDPTNLLFIGAAAPTNKLVRAAANAIGWNTPQKLWVPPDTMASLARTAAQRGILTGLATGAAGLLVDTVIEPNMSPEERAAARAPGLVAAGAFLGSAPGIMSMRKALLDSRSVRLVSDAVRAAEAQALPLTRASGTALNDETAKILGVSREIVDTANNAVKDRLNQKLISSPAQPVQEYPGGYTRKFFDDIRSGWTDQYAYAKTLQTVADGLYRKATGQDLPDSLRIGDKLQLAMGIRGKVENLLSEQVRPVFGRYGYDVSFGSQLGKDFDTWRSYYVAYLKNMNEWKDLAARARDADLPIPSKDPKIATSFADLQDFSTKLGKSYNNADLPTHFEQIINELTGMVYNPLLQDLERTGILAKGKAQQIIDKHDPYLYVTNPDNMYDASVRAFQGVTPSKGTPVKFEQSVKSLEDSGFKGELEHIGNRMTMIEKNDVVKSFLDLRTVDPFFQKIIRPWTGAETAAPEGWSKIVHWENGKPNMYITEKWLADMMNGAQKTMLDPMTLAASRFATLTRLGSTVFNLPFALLVNPVRDTQEAIANFGMPGFLLRNWLGSLYGVLSLPEFAMAKPVATGIATGLASALAPADDLGERVDRFTKGAAAGFAGGMVGGRMGAYDTLAHTGVWRNLDRLANLPAVQKEIRSMMAAGGRIGTPSEAARAIDRDMRDILSLNQGKRGPWYSVITSMPEAVRAMSEVMELTTRANVYRAATHAGMSAQSSALAAREATLDFSKSGYLMQLVNAFVPFLNARTQGSLRSLKAMRDDPQAYAIRQIGMTAMPSAAVWAYNRAYFNDLYDKIPQSERDAYWNIIIGSQPPDNRGIVRPITLKIPKGFGNAMFAAPLETMLDDMFHDKAYGTPTALQGIRNNPTLMAPMQRMFPNEIQGPDTRQGVDLPPERRNERTHGSMWAQTLLNALLPYNVKPEDVTNPRGHALAVASAIPVIGPTVESLSNYDYFRGEDIIPPEQKNLPPEYQMGSGFKPAAGVISRAVPSDAPWKPAPATIDFLVKRYGSWAGNAFEGAADQLMNIPGMPWSSPRPGQPGGLQKPDSITDQDWNQYVAQMNREDPRPRNMQVAAALRLFGPVGNQQSLGLKLQGMPPAQQKAVQQTLELDRTLQGIGEKYRGQERVIYDQPGMTAEEMRNKIADLWKEERGEKDRVRGEYTAKGAVIDPQERKTLMDSIPGVPIPREAYQMAGLPPQADIDQMVSRYTTPLPVDQMAMLNPVQQKQVRSDEIQKMAAELQVDPSIVSSAIKSRQQGRTFPLAGVPALWVNEAVDAYLSPSEQNYITEAKDPNTNATVKFIDQDKLRNARRAEIQTVAAKYKLDPKDLEDRITLVLEPLDATPAEASYHRALNLSGKVHDDVLFPRYVGPDGQPWGNPADWDKFDQQIKTIKSGQATPYAQQMQAAKYRGEQARLKALYYGVDRSGLPMDQTGTNPDNNAARNLKDYQRWFGIGSGMTNDDWQSYLDGSLVRYNKVPRSYWDKLDYAMKVYQILPPGNARANFAAGPDRNSDGSISLSALYRVGKNSIVPHWAERLALDAIREKMLQTEQP